ncbi:MAG: hypothetical protein HY481_01395 [Candidatus Vogelbacteria bacterium]|nr:hypothetical protein [Candidatus Vogelbacteria bacterium]
MVKSAFDYLAKLRQRPEPVRRRALLFLSGGLTLVIFFFWLLNLKYAGPLAHSTEAEEVKVTTQSASAGATLPTGRQADALARIKAGWQVLRDRFSN